VLNFSFEIADELGGYMLVVMTFVSLSVCQANNAFHQVELLQARLKPRGRALSAAISTLLSFGVAALLLWHFIRLECRPGVRPSAARPFWRRRCGCPASPMAIGAAAAVLLDSAPFLAHVRRFPHAVAGLKRMLGPELQILIVTVLFLACSPPGWRCHSPLRCRRSSMLLMQGGFHGTQRPRPDELGSMNTFALTAVPCSWFMADIWSVSG